MRTQAEISALLTNPGVIAVVRTQRPEQVLPLCAALVEGGLTALEITFTVPNACEVVAAVVKEFGARVTVGVGTVLRASQLKSDRKSTRLNSSHVKRSRMPSSA